jgi:ankyrin repeat protein
LYVAVENDDAEIARLLIIGHGADVYAHTRMRLRMRQNPKNNVIATFPSEFWAHGSCTAEECRADTNGISRHNHIRTSRVFYEVARGVDVDKLLPPLSGPNAVCFDLNYFWPISTMDHHQVAPLNNSKRARTNRDQVATLLMQSGRMDCDMRDAQGNLPLHHACNMAYTTVVPLLFASTAVPNARNHHGDTPFDLLLQCSNNMDDDELARKTWLVTTVLESGLVDINEPDDDSGMTPFHRACMGGCASSIVKLLLPHVRAFDLEDHAGHTPYQLAMERGSFPVVVALLEHRAAHISASKGETLSDIERRYIQLMDLVSRRDPTISTRPSVGEVPFTALHCGAYYLDASIVQVAISLQATLGQSNPGTPAWNLPVHWGGNLAFELEQTQDYDYGLLGTPLFIAMNRATQNHHENSPETESITHYHSFREVFDGLLSVPSLDLSDRPGPRVSPATAGYVQKVKMSLIASCCNSQMLGRMARGGLSIPWASFLWAPNNSIAMFQGFPSYPIRKRHLTTILLSVICDGHYRLVDIATENFHLAKGMLASGLIKPGSLNLEGETELAVLTARHQSVAMLQQLLALGFDGKSALLHAVEEGSEDQVDILLRTEDEAVVQAAAAGYDIAVRNGFNEMAETLASAASARNRLN